VYFPATPSLDAAICVLGLSVMACVQHAVMYERSDPRQLKDISSSSASVSYRVVSFHPAWLRLDRQLSDMILYTSCLYEVVRSEHNKSELTYFRLRNRCRSLSHYACEIYKRQRARATRQPVKDCKGGKATIWRTFQP
jgi:hypothetical protein